MQLLEEKENKNAFLLFALVDKNTNTLKPWPYIAIGFKKMCDCYTKFSQEAMWLMDGAFVFLLLFPNNSFSFHS